MNQQPKKPRFYVDAIQYTRAFGGIKQTQVMNHTDNNAPTIESNEMFHNNGARNWRTEATPGWLKTAYEHTITDDSTHTYMSYKTDFAVKLDRYYALTTINYFGFLGHNFGRSQCLVEPYISYYNNSGKEEYDGTTNKNIWNSAGDYIAENLRINLSEVVTDYGAENHKFINCEPYQNMFAFFDIENNDDDPTDDELDLTIGRDVGWAIVRFNDNNKSDDTFDQVFNIDGGNSNFGRADLTYHNSIGFRIYEAAMHDHSGKESYVPHINAFSCGWTYLLDKSPDLDITMSFEFDGIKTKKGLSGQNLTNINYAEPTPWQFLKRIKSGTDGTVSDNYDIFDIAAWYQHNGQPNHNLAGFANYKGRRIWKLKFSYMSGQDLFDSNSSGWSHPQLNYTSQNEYFTPHKTVDGFHGIDNHFMARVINGTLGGKLPFLFQPDSERDNDIFLCEFADNGISFKQVANGVWSFDLTIREVW